jgi:hypothetical protein
MPDLLRGLGYIVEKTGESERIMPVTMSIEVVEQYDVMVPPGPPVERRIAR